MYKGKKGCNMEADTAFYLALFIVMMVMNMLFYMFLTVVRNLTASEIEKHEGILSSRTLERLRRTEANSLKYENRAMVGIFILTFLGGWLFCATGFELFNRYVKNGFVGMITVENAILEELLSIGIFFMILIILLVLVITFVVLVPRRLAKRMKLTSIAFVITLGVSVSLIFQPVSFLTNVLAKGILYLFGIKKPIQEKDVTEEGIISMVNEGQELGVLEADEAEMITNIFEYGDKEAQDVMTIRNNIAAIDSSFTLQEAIVCMLENNNSRYPVYEENLDQIIGILNLKDAVRFQSSHKKATDPIGTYPELLREAVFVPETKKLDDLFKEMQSSKLQMVIVSDEYGQTSGLVAMEDILEEIVGNIMDEYDVEEEYIEERSADVYEIEGLTPLEELEEELEITFDSEEMDTLNGFLISKMDRIPEEDEDFEMEYKGYYFKVLETENRTIKTVLVSKVKK